MKVVYSYIHHILLSTRQAPANHYGEFYEREGGGVEGPTTRSKRTLGLPKQHFCQISFDNSWSFKIKGRLVWRGLVVGNPEYYIRIKLEFDET